MANQNVPTHVFGGAVALAGNSYPSTSAANITYGGFAPTFEVTGPTATPRTIASNDGLVFFVVPAAALAYDLPAASSSMDGRIYTFYVRPGGAGQTLTITAGGVAISGGTVTTAQKANTVTVIYSAGVVLSQLVIGA